MSKFKIFFIVVLLLICNLFISNFAVGEVMLPRAKNQTGDIISLDVKNINLVDALRLIADQSGLNIVTSKNVRGTITVKLKDVPVEDALMAILEVNNCKYVKEGNIIKIYTYQDIQQEERFRELETKVFSPEFARASEIKPLFLAVKSPRGKIEINSKTNQIIIIDTPDVIKQVESIIEELDKETELQIFDLNYADPTEIQTKLTQFIPKTEGEIMVDIRTKSIIVKALPGVRKEVEMLIKRWDMRNRQVQIEAKMLGVTRSDSLELGIAWEYKTALKHGPSTMDLKGDFSPELTEGAIFKVGTLTADDYEVTLEMLATQADTDVLSSPKITVLDGQEASILVGSAEPYIITSEDPVTGFVTESTQWLDVGIKLIVTPKIGYDNHITMHVHPEVSSARRVAEADEALAVDTTEATTTLTVKNGETVILGGLMREDIKKTIKKIPFLGDIPLLGLIFRKIDEQKMKKELIVFITPHVLNAEGKIIADGEEQKIEKLIRETIKRVKKRREYKRENKLEQD